MNELFSQGGKGSTGILTNKQAVARHFGVKQSEVVYFSVGALLTGYKVIYDKVAQRAYTLPADIGSGVTAVSLSPAGVLVHSAGNVDLGALAVAREEYVTLPGSFDTGVTVNTKNELVVFTDGKYRWDGTLPKAVPAGSTPASTGGVGLGAWVSVGDASLRSDLAKTNGAGLIGGLSKPITFWGAVGDGVTNDTAAFVAAEAAGVNDIYLPDGNFVVNNIALNKRYSGPGVIVRSGIGAPTLTGTGLNDITFSGTYSGIAANSLMVKILTTGTPDTLAWSADGGATWVDKHLVYNPITDSYDESPINVGPTPYLILVGVYVAFASTTGHTVGDTWTVSLLRNPKVLEADGGFYQKGKPAFSLFGVHQVAMGEDAFGSGRSVGSGNIGGGYKALYANTTGYANIAFGGETLKNNTGGFFNIGIGSLALGENSTGTGNIALGTYTLGANTTGLSNVALGTDAGRYNQTGNGNTAVGTQSLYHNRAGIESTAVGNWALRGGSASLPTGTNAQFCVAVGSKSLFTGVSNNNTAVGFESLYNTTGTDNVALGFDAGFRVTSGSYNVFVGSQAGQAADQTPNVSNCVLLGDNTKSSGSNAVAIGSGVTAAQNTIAIGNSSHTDIFLYGNLKPQLDNTFSIGSSSARYTQVYATNGTINTSDERLKTPLDFNLLDAEKRAAVEIKKHIGKFRWLDSDGSKIHFGVGAQTVEQILTKNGLNSNDYAFLVKENGTYGINYGELAMFILSTI